MKSLVLYLCIIVSMIAGGISCRGLDPGRHDTNDSALNGRKHKLIDKFLARNDALVYILPEKIGPIIHGDTNLVEPANPARHAFIDTNLVDNSAQPYYVTVTYWVQPRDTLSILAAPTQITLTLDIRPGFMAIIEQALWWAPGSGIPGISTWKGSDYGYLTAQYSYATGAAALEGKSEKCYSVFDEKHNGRQFDTKAAGHFKNYLKDKAAYLPYDPAVWEREYESGVLKARQ